MLTTMALYLRRSSAICAMTLSSIAIAFFTSASRSIFSCFSLAMAASIVSFSAFSACVRSGDGGGESQRGIARKGKSESEHPADREKIRAARAYLERADVVAGVRHRVLHRLQPRGVIFGHLCSFERVRVARRRQWRAAARGATGDRRRR